MWDTVLTWRQMIRLQVDIDLPVLPQRTSVDAAYLPLDGAFPGRIVVDVTETFAEPLWERCESGVVAGASDSHR